MCLHYQTWWEVEWTKNYENLALMLLEMCPEERISAILRIKRRFGGYFGSLFQSGIGKKWILPLGHFTDSKNRGCKKSSEKRCTLSWFLSGRRPTRNYILNLLAHNWEHLRFWNSYKLLDWKTQSCPWKWLQWTEIEWK